MRMYACECRRRSRTFCQRDLGLTPTILSRGGRTEASTSPAAVPPCTCVRQQRHCTCGAWRRKVVGFIGAGEKEVPGSRRSSEPNQLTRNKNCTASTRFLSFRTRASRVTNYGPFP